MIMALIDLHGQGNHSQLQQKAQEQQQQHCSYVPLLTCLACYVFASTRLVSVVRLASHRARTLLGSAILLGWRAK